MPLYDHIRKISFLFFLFLGLAHFTAGFFSVQGFFTPTSGLVNRVLFIPFVLAALTYSLSSAKCRLLELGRDSKTWNTIGLGFLIVIFASLLAIELLVKDSPTPLLQ